MSWTANISIASVVRTQCMHARPGGHGRWRSHGSRASQSTGGDRDVN
jgi:hypothetical protein